MALNGINVIEVRSPWLETIRAILNRSQFAGLAPGPFAGLVLAHNGASVIRIDRPSSTSGDLLCAGKRSIALDMKTASGLRVAKELIAKADVLIDPFRPGVLEKLGLGPEVFHTCDKRKGLNDGLVYARLAG
jgi:alpha-methylacyl-CoA racemase